MSKRRRKDCQQRFTSSEVAPVPDHHSQTGLLTPPLTELWENRETALAALEAGRDRRRLVPDRGHRRVPDVDP